MAEELEEVVEETTDQPVEEVVEKKVDESKFQSAGDDSIIKIDLSKPPVQESEEVEQQPAEKENVDVVEKVQDVAEEAPVLQEVTEEEISEVEEEIEEAVAEAEATGQPI